MASIDELNNMFADIEGTDSAGTPTAESDNSLGDLNSMFADIEGGTYESEDDQDTGGMLGALLGSMFVEMSFNYQGFGYWFTQAVFAGDYNVIAGFSVFSIIVTLITTLVSDVAYTIIDPRITYK